VAGFAHQPAPVRLPRVEIRVNAILRDEQIFLWRLDGVVVLELAAAVVRFG
jgi:hypothetical protein